MTEPKPIEASPSTVIVGCKLPHGLKLEIFDRGPKERDRQVVESYTLNGANASRIVGGYGLTDGIPKGFWDRWAKENAAHKALKNGSIFVHATVDGARSIAKETGGDVRTGFEAVDPLKAVKDRKIALDADGLKEYRQQVNTNPDRNRQQQE